MFPLKLSCSSLKYVCILLVLCSSDTLVYDSNYKIMTDIMAFNLPPSQVSQNRITKFGNCDK